MDGLEAILEALWALWGSKMAKSQNSNTLRRILMIIEVPQPLLGAKIAINSGLEGGVIVEKVRNLDGANGLNASSGEYEDLIKAGIIDAAKVTRSALQNAGSIAALFNPMTMHWFQSSVRSLIWVPEHVV